MEIIGRIIKILDIRSGISKTKGTEWMSQTYILETQESRPRLVAFEVYGEDKIKSMNIQVGEDLKVYIEIDAREYNYRWYNQVRAWRVDRTTENNGQTSVPVGFTSTTQSNPFAGTIDPLPFEDTNEQLDLPF